MTEGIILIHGIFRTNSCMKKISKFLESKNYKTLNVEFPSTKYDILSLAKIIHPQVKEFSQQVTKINFIGHSLGGLIIRAYLHVYRVENLGRVVMLGTPNHGSELADFLQDFYIYKKLYGPSGQQLRCIKDPIATDPCF
jgi:triacylglycerol esterase/lipase EstA (alpha/beta hydrolase family)